MKKAYQVEVSFNGETKKKSTDNISEALMSLKPEFVFTELYLTVKKDNDVRERVLKLNEARKIFQDDMYREIIINGLMI